MNFLVDAHLPRQLVLLLRSSGHDAIHTRNLPMGNRSTDAVILQVAATENRVVITKDSDFVDSHLLRNQPPKLLLISTGNIKNIELLHLFEQNLEQIIIGLTSFDYVELDRENLIYHR